MPNYVTVRHRDTDAKTIVPEKVLPGFESRGWERVDTTPEPAVSVPDTEPEFTDDVEEND